MTLNEETRQSKTRNRSAVITPTHVGGWNNRRRYAIVMLEQGKLITRSFKVLAPNITTARRIARAWCE